MIREGTLSRCEKGGYSGKVCMGRVHWEGGEGTFGRREGEGRCSGVVPWLWVRVL